MPLAAAIATCNASAASLGRQQTGTQEGLGQGLGGSSDLQGGYPGKVVKSALGHVPVAQRSLFKHQF
jgi:hypothetical protein